MWLGMSWLSSQAAWGPQGMTWAQWMAALALKQGWMMTRMLRGMQTGMVTAWKTPVERVLPRQRG